MPEAGGPTTQSGILYQNSIAALYLGRLCDPIPRRASEQVTNVRVEALENVDDIVVTFADGHTTYIQAKEDIQFNGEVWTKLWQDFKKQFENVAFRHGQDRLLLHLGPENKGLRELCERALASKTAQEWKGRLVEEQSKVLTKIKLSMSPPINDDEFWWRLLSHVDIESRTLLGIERDLVPYWIPASNHKQFELFSLIRGKVGGKARRRGEFDAQGLLASLAADESDIRIASQPSYDELREAVQVCGANLKQYKNTLGNSDIYLERPVIGEIVTWLTADESERKVAVLLDQAGMGKTVVMRALAQSLEDAGVLTLVIKADQLSGIDDLDELQRKLELPDRVERVLRRLATEELTVLLIDQIDALSLSLAHDQSALNTLLELVARVRLIPHVRVLISCRTFDFNNDPRLAKIETERKFHIPELTESEIQSVLEKIGVSFDHLTPTTKKLLGVPLHLDLYVRIVEEFPQGQTNSEVAIGPEAGSLQELYALLWQKVIAKASLHAPPVAARERVIRLIVEEMDKQQHISIPPSFINTIGDNSLITAASWLASEGILLPAKDQWTLFHQTFFDYCYAKNFAETGSCLYEKVVQSDQGLFVRPQIVQILSYLRGIDATRYGRELSDFLSKTEIRFHLRDHVLRWFGNLPNPSEFEWTLARRLLIEPERRKRLLWFIRGNAGWFRRLKAGLERDLATQDDTQLDTETLPFLFSMFEAVSGEVADVLRPYLGKKGERWVKRWQWVLGQMRNWRTHKAVKFYEEVFAVVPLSHSLDFHQIDDIAKVDARASCRLVRQVLDKILDVAKASLQEGSPYVFSLNHELEAIHGSTIVEALKIISSQEPAYFLKQVLPWISHTFNLAYPDSTGPSLFLRDPLSHHWDETVYVIHRSLIDALIYALANLAKIAPADFAELSLQLSASPYETSQRLLTRAYSKIPKIYADAALSFLLEDSRRLNLGNEQFDSRQLIKAIVPYLSDAQATALETAILSFRVIYKRMDVWDLRRRGLKNLYLLQCLPTQKLTAGGVKRLRELERKFPNRTASDSPITSEGGFVGSPISTEAVKKMSDKSWLRAIKKYQGNVTHKSFLKGGARELASVLSQETKENPARFYALAMRAPTSIDLAYINAFVGGLAESLAPANMLFDVVRRFVDELDSESATGIFWALEKRAHEDFPDDLMNLLEKTVRGPAYQEEERWHEAEPERPRGQHSYDILNNGLYSGYLNSIRGAASRALVKALAHKAGEAATAKRWEIVDFVIAEGSAVLQAGALVELIYLLSNDRERCVNSFESLIVKEPSLLRTHFALEFIYYAHATHYKRLRHFIESAMNDDYEAVQQRGAELACLAALCFNKLDADEYESANGLALRARTGLVTWKKGAARIYLRNVRAKTVTAFCREQLTYLLEEPNDDVHNIVTNVFFQMDEALFLDLRDFIEQYVASRRLGRSIHHFAEVLWEHGLLFPEWSLSVVAKLCATENANNDKFQYLSVEPLIKLVIRIYTDPSVSNETKIGAMDLFDKLMELFSAQANRILEEWDRT